MFEQVTRKKAKLRMALMGVSGAGKTLSALYIAYGITGDWSKVALIWARDVFSTRPSLHHIARSAIKSM